MKPSKVIRFKCVSMREEHSLDNLPSMFANFSISMGLLVVSFEKDINSLLSKIKARKGHGVKVSGGKEESSLIIPLGEGNRKTRMLLEN